VRYYLPLHATVLLLFSASTALAQGGGVASPNMGNPGIVDVLEGAGSDRVWSFDIGADWWTIHRAPGPVGAGGAIASRFNDCDYVLQGGGTQTFFKAGAMCSFQGSVRLADAPFVPGAGAALIAANAISVDLEDFVYALAGGGASEFWRYSVSRNQWVRMADVPVGGAFPRRRDPRDRGKRNLQRVRVQFRQQSMDAAGRRAIHVRRRLHDGIERRQCRDARGRR
jgi:hypothetical protein